MPGERRESRRRVSGYLSGVQRLNEVVDGVPAARGRRDPRTADEIARGVPVLRSRALDPAVFDQAGTLVRAMAVALLGSDLPEPLREQCRTLLGEDLGALVRSVAARGEAPAGFGDFLAWKALGRLLRASTEGWHSSACPTCGALPAMAALRPGDRGRERELSCGLCGTRWSWARIGCPFCAGADKLDVLEPEGHDAFRIDVCRACNAYLKTYVGEGEAQALSDWSTLHLDAACLDRGLQRPGPSLYRL